MEIREQLLDVMKKSGIREVEAGPTRWESVRRANCSSYFANSAVLKGVSQYVNLLNVIPCFVHPSSGLFWLGYTPDYVVYHELVITSKEWMRHVTTVDAEWLAELGPLFFTLAGANPPPSISPTPSPNESSAKSTSTTTVATPSRPTVTALAGVSSLQAARDKRNKMMKRTQGWES